MLFLKEIEDRLISSNANHLYVICLIIVDWFSSTSEEPRLQSQRNKINMSVNLRKVDHLTIQKADIKMWHEFVGKVY